MKIVYLFQPLDADEPEHVVAPMANVAFCGYRLGRTGDVVSACFAEDVVLATTCADCVKALDE